MASKVEVIVLGLLAEGPAHGYELLERLRARSSDLWAEVGRASVYQTLARLERAGALRGRARPGREGPDRRVYSITSLGRSRLRDGVAALLADAGPDDAAAIAFAFLHTLSPRRARAALDDRREALEASVSSVDAALASADAVGAVDTLRRRRALLEAELRWLARAGRSLAGAGTR
ncbi:MAG TPA: PadR family transcriptional regulator [Actinomycetota bacterium]